VLWQPGTPLALFLAHDPHWKVVWHTSQAVVFRATGAQTAQPKTSG